MNHRNHPIPAMAADSRDIPALDDRADLQEYRSLSVPAVISFVLGLASVLAMVQIVLMVIPFAGLAASCLALARTRTTVTTGRTLALIGLVLSAFFGGLALTRYMADQTILRNYAQQAADQWIALVQAGRLHEAHQWSLSTSLRVERQDLLDAYYAEHFTTRNSMTEMFQRDGLRELVQLGKQGRVRLTGYRQVFQDRSQQSFEFDYRVTGDGVDVPLSLLVVRRWNLDYLRHDWIIGPVPKKE